MRPIDLYMAQLLPEVYRQIAKDLTNLNNSEIENIDFRQRLTDRVHLVRVQQALDLARVAARAVCDEHGHHFNDPELDAIAASVPLERLPFGDEPNAHTPCQRCGTPAWFIGHIVREEIGFFNTTVAKFSAASVDGSAAGNTDTLEANALSSARPRAET